MTWQRLVAIKLYVARKRAKRKAETRRTEGAVIDGRAARVIEAVFEATGAELADKGYAALRVEDVAERAGVNKTTIYRRWPQKKDLVIAAMKSMTLPPHVAPTGSIERDLLVALKNVVAYATSPAGRAAARVMLGAHNDRRSIASPPRCATTFARSTRASSSARSTPVSSRRTRRSN